MSEAQAVKPRKRQTAKPSDHQAVKKGTTVYLSPDALERLIIHATKAGLDRSAYLEDLINKNCRRYVVHDRGGSSETAGTNTSVV
jgi:predicted alternative tryptophan synthase beta-subunit